jgi:uncharacterized protein YdaU (DUF1376 family)
MHYYKKNIGDYHKKAGRLSMLQHGAYTLLMDACYDRETFPALDEAIDWLWASSADEVDAVKFVLGKFFTLEDGFYVQNHIKEDLDKYHNNSAQNKRIAIEREAKRREKRTKRARSVHEAPRDDHEAPPNQEPLTTNQEPKEPKEPWFPPETLNIEAWYLFTAHRKEINKPLKTDRTKTGQANKLKDLTPDQQMAVVNLSCDEGWVGLFPEKITAPQAKSFNQPAQQEGAKFRPYVHEKTERTAPPAGTLDKWSKEL